MYENNKNIGWKKKENNNGSNYDDSLIKNQINILDEEIEEVSSQLAHNTSVIKRVLYVTDYKCIDGEKVKGDGIHDDTSGIQNAFDELRDGDTLVFPKGEYKVNRISNNTYGVCVKLKNNINIVGENATITSTEDLTENSYAMLKVISCNNVSISGFTFNSYFESNANTRSNAYSVQFESSINTSTNIEVGCTNIRFFNNNITSRPTSPDYGSLACYGVLFGSYPNRLTGKIADGFICENNTFIDCEGRGVQTWKSKNVKILNNSFINCGYYKSLNTIRMIGGVEGLIVSNNTVISNPNSQRVVGITIGSGSGSEELYQAENVAISNNVIKIDSGTSSNKSIGINLIGCINGVISSNTITTKNMLNGSVVGIAIDEAEFDTENITINNNNINGCSISQISVTTTKIKNIVIFGNYLGINNYSPTSSSTIKGTGASLCTIKNNYSELHKNIVNSTTNQVVGYVSSSDELPNPAVFPCKVGDIYYCTNPVKNGCIGWVIVLNDSGYKQFAKFGQITDFI